MGEVMSVWSILSMCRWQERLTAISVYFDNDQAGYAVKNAAELKGLVGHQSQRAA